MDRVEVVKAYFDALDSSDIFRAGQYLAEDYRLVDFDREPLDKVAMLEFVSRLKVALPNLKHSLSNLREEDNVVRVTVQRSGTNSGQLDLRKMGIGIVPGSKRFIIFPNGDYEFTVVDGKIKIERDVSPASQNRKMSGMLKAFGVNPGIL